MHTNGSNFEIIMQELLNQKQRYEELMAENKELHSQLDALRAGNGITLDILGYRIPLLVNAQTVSPTASQPDPTLQETTVMPTDELQQPASEFIEYEVEEEEQDSEQTDTSVPVPTTSTFLEEALIDEFSSATTRQMSVWNGPTSNTSSLDEDAKAALRRELMGSFLLE